MNNDIGEKLSAALGECQKEIEDAVTETLQETAKEALEVLKTNVKIPRKTGEYAEGFYMKKKTKGTNLAFLVRNKKYRIGHLLENPHKTRNKAKMSRAFPHWRDAQKVADTLPERLKEALSK